MSGTTGTMPGRWPVAGGSTSAIPGQGAVQPPSVTQPMYPPAPPTVAGPVNPPVLPPTVAGPVNPPVGQVVPPPRPRRRLPVATQAATPTAPWAGWPQGPAVTPQRKQ
jgi:hypothetical protein